MCEATSTSLMPATRCSGPPCHWVILGLVAGGCTSPSNDGAGWLGARPLPEPLQETPRATLDGGIYIADGLDAANDGPASGLAHTDPVEV